MRHTALVLALAFAGGPLGAQQPPDSATLARARAVLHHDLFAVAGWPIVSVELRPCGRECWGDSFVVVQQRQDTVTLELAEGYQPTTASYGPVEDCNSYRSNPEALASSNCLDRRPYRIVQYVWLELRGPLPARARGVLLDHLVQLSWSPAHLRPN